MSFNDYHKIVLFGDSITERSFEQHRGFGFGAALSDVYRRKMEVLNRGFGGYNTAHALYVLPKILPPPSKESQIKLMLVFFGANDSVISGQPQHVELNEYRQNIKSIIFHDKVKPHNSKILLIAPSPICEYTTQEHNEIRGKPIIQRLASKTKEYAEAAVEVGEEIGIPVVNLWQIFIDYAGGWREGEPIPGSKSLPRNEKLCNLFIDGLHFDSKGYQLMYDSVISAIKNYYPDLDPESLENIFPTWENCPRYNG